MVDAATGAVEVEACVVDEIAGLLSAALAVDVKWTVNRAGPCWSFVRLMVMGTEGLWYLRRGKQVRQNFLGVVLDSDE